MNAPDTKPLGGTAIMNPSHDKQSTFETALQESESGFSATNPAGFKIDESYSNRRLLCISFFTFMSFALAQTTAALIAGSQAMLADSITMMVDSFAYIFNWYAERQKCSYASNLNGHKRSVLLYRKYTYQLELLPPLLSVLILLVLTIYIARGAIKTLILDIERDESEQATPNVKLMIAFSLINLFFDLFNVFCFARAKHAFGYKTKLDPDEIIPINKRPTSTTKSQSDYSDSQEDGNADMEDGREDETSKGMQSLEIESYGYSRDGHRHDHGDESSNLNMCSAYTVSIFVIVYFNYLTISNCLTFCFVSFNHK